MLYLTLKFAHVFLAAIAIGFNASYGLLVARARRTGTDELRFALRAVVGVLPGAEGRIGIYRMPRYRCSS